MPIVGDVLAGRYRIDAPIGVGGMASVYQAFDLRLERDVAVKVLLPNLAADPTLSQRFEREALALAATSHPSVVKVFDVEPGDPTTGREPFYVMELCDGGSLADRQAAHGRVDPGVVVDVIGAVAAGLADLHGRGFVHRDVKPHNILFDHERARLADFGLARSDRAELTSLTATGTTAGTLAYLAPELLRGDPATPASDVYALGVVAFQALTGRLPRPATTVTELVESHGAAAPRVSSIVPELGTSFDAAVAAALAIDPSARPSPLGLAEALAAARPRGDRPAGAAGPAVMPAVAAPAVPAADPGDPGADTVTDVPAEWPADAPERTRATRPGPPASLLAIGVIGLALVAFLALTSLLGDGDRGSSGDPTLPAITTADVSPSPVATPSPTPTPTPDPTPAPDPAEAALAALGRVDAAIESLANEQEVRKRDVDTLRKRARDVRKALEADDYGQARVQTARLSDEVDKVDERIDGNAIDELKDAVSDLAAALPAG